MGGTAAVVAANAWMNQPAGITLQDGKVVDVQPVKVFFNRAFWYENIHMLLAAYLVAGFVVAGVYATGMLRGRRDRYHRIGFLIPFTRRRGGDALPDRRGRHRRARGVPQRAREVRRDRDPAPPRARTSPRRSAGVLKDGRVRGGIPIPDGASLLAGYSPNTQIQGLDAVPADVRPPDRPGDRRPPLVRPDGRARVRAAGTVCVVRLVVVAAS